MIRVKRSLRRAVAALPRPSYDAIATETVTQSDVLDLSAVTTALPAVRRHHLFEKKVGIKRPAWLRIAPAFGLAAACCAILLMVGINRNTYNIITLDVNPSVELRAHLSGEVVSAKALNEDATALLAGTELEGMALADAMTVLAEGLAEQGYIHDGDSAIVAVGSRSAAEAKRVHVIAADAFEDALAAEGVEPVILELGVVAESELVKSAESKEVSLGREALCVMLAELNPQLTEAELASMTNSELVSLADQLGLDVNTAYDVNIRYAEGSSSGDYRPDGSPAPTEEPAATAAPTQEADVTPDATGRPAGYGRDDDDDDDDDEPDDDDDNDDEPDPSDEPDDDDDDDDEPDPSDDPDDDDDDDDEPEPTDEPDDDDDDDDDDDEPDPSDDPDDDDDDDEPDPTDDPDDDDDDEPDPSDDPDDDDDDEPEPSDSPLPTP